MAGTLLENIEHHCKFENCTMALALGELKNHEAVCPNRTVNCPHPSCPQKVSLAKLVDHLERSE